MIKRIIHNKYVFSIFTKLIIVILGLLNSVIINRFLGPSLKGEYSVILNILNLIVMVSNLGIYQSFPFLKKHKNIDVSKYIDLIFLQFTLYSIISVILYFITKFDMIIFLLPPVMVLTRQLSFISLVEKINLRNVLNIFNTLFYTLILFMIYSFFSVDYVPILYALLIKDIILIITITAIFKYRPSFAKVDFPFIFEAIKYGIVPMISLLLINLNYKADIIMLDFYVNSYSIGIYSVGILIAEQTWLIVDSFKEVLFSKSSKANNIFEIITVIKINIYLTTIITVVFLFLGDFLIVFLYGKDFKPAYEITLLILFGSYGMIFFKLLYPYYISNGIRKITLFYLSIVVLVNLSLNFFLIPYFGNVGSAIASIVSYNLCGLLFLKNFSRRNNIHIKEYFQIRKKDFLQIINTFRRIN